MGGGSIVEVEVFLTANESVNILGGVHDLPCSLAGQPGSLGTVNTLFATANPDGVGGFGPSRDGLPYLYFPMNGAPAYHASLCAMLHSGGLGSVAIVPAGATRYLATHYLQVSDCAVGAFDLYFEGVSNPAQFKDTTYFYAVEPPNLRFNLAVINALLEVPSGSCCDGESCVADNINEFCCEQTYPWARWIDGRSCSDAVPCPDCVLDAECDDGTFCNGAEHCDPTTGTCQPSTPPTCDDGVACTADSCDAELDECTHTLFDPACDDGVFCNGAETCHATLGCQLALPPTCDDDVVCTVDSCDASLDACVNIPSNAACDDDLFCNGAETCDATAGCQAGAPPCTGSVPVDDTQVFLDCDEADDTCVVPPIPTVSTWGLITLALSLLTLAKLRRPELPKAPCR